MRSCCVPLREIHWKCAKYTLYILVMSLKISNLRLQLHFLGNNESIQSHGWPSTQPGSLHTALQRGYTQPCSLFSRGMAVWTMGAWLCQQWGHGCVNNGGMAVWTMGAWLCQQWGHGCVNNGGMAVSTMGNGCVHVPGCVEGHPWILQLWMFYHLTPEDL